MMRQPTPESELYAWWRAALADPSTPRHDGEPHCGFYKIRMVKGGPWVPVEIVCRREIDKATGELLDDERLQLIIEGDETKENPANRWTHLRPITRDDFARLARARLTPNAPVAAQTIDLSAAPTLP